MNEQQQQLRSSDKAQPPLPSGSNMDRDAELRDFVTIYKWRVIRQDTPWNVQRFAHNHCEEAQDFTTYEDAVAFASSFNLPVVHEHAS